MKVDELLKQPGSWLVPGEDNPILITSRIRLARNLQDHPYPGWADEEERVRIWTDLRASLGECALLKEPVSYGMDEITSLDRLVLFERRLISREQSEKKKGSGIVLRPDESLAVMVNEEDHLRMQAMRPGLDLRANWKQINELDNQIEAKVRYAFSPRLGYLTACPTNVGTGMRASVMLHVPGLVLMNEISAVIKGMSKIGLAVRGLWGEGSEAAGNMFQVSNQMTLGDREEDIISNLEQIVLEIVEHERNARIRLMEDQENLVRDHVGRALGILSQAYAMNSKEALDLLSHLRLGLDLGILHINDRTAVNDLLILTQPGHLQKMERKKLKAAERDVARARRIRQRMAQALKPSKKSK